MNNVEKLVQEVGLQAKKASYLLATLPSEKKIAALLSIAQALNDERSYIKSQNALDIKDAKESGLKPALIERLTLTDKVIDSMIESVLAIAKLSDPVGKLITSKVLDNEMVLEKIRVPLGVIGIIFESRPNVISDVAALCLMSGNAVILRGGKEAQHSNRAIMQAVDQGLQKVDFTPFSVQMIPVQDREAVTYLCQLENYVDVIIPRGGEGLIRSVSECARVPVIKHYKGVCHIYVDGLVDQDMALNICHNAKCQRPSVCNAAETILISEKIAVDFLPKLAKRLSDAGVIMFACERSRAIVDNLEVAQESDWSEEYLDLRVAIKIVADVGSAIEHINTYGSHHSDAIVSNDKSAQNRFIKEVDSAAVYVNASTRFTDGFVFGLGAEMGISTDKLHARGPMGLVELTTYKWVGHGSGQVRG